MSTVEWLIFYSEYFKLQAENAKKAEEAVATNLEGSLAKLKLDAKCTECGKLQELLDTAQEKLHGQQAEMRYFIGEEQLGLYKAIPYNVKQLIVFPSNDLAPDLY